jgi:dipeptidyl aminopeptidase/acylaminoacyl peptidase
MDDQTIFSGTCPQSLPEDFEPAGVITFTVIYDFQKAAQLSDGLNDYTVDLLGGTYDEVPEIWNQASPASWVDGNEPPFLLIHGGDDQSIPPTQSEEFAEILRAAGGVAELLIIEGGSHMQVKGSTESMEAVEEFLSQILSSSS